MDAPIYWPSVFFFLFAGLACAFALAVVISPNIVRMAFYLVLSLASTAGLFFLAGADFVGAMQIMIYVGGTLVLLVFGVMLTSQDRFISMKTSAFDMGLALGVGICFFLLLWYAALSVPGWRGITVEQANAVQLQPTASPIGMGLLGARVDAPDRSGYLLVFEIISIHLLVVLIGAAYLARARRRKTLLLE
ncbi:MAG TPA: NADH-quinone oxidoreductase subunit J [Lacipirellulaceae bacterium]|jgi:NADH:ubiquinone oxidoreductase subunit 6 (subunit J)|nr:NADH-quinone oxidoreductase subunit J [Lacipirellulaceae bacterium]